MRLFLVSLFAGMFLAACTDSSSTDNTITEVDYHHLGDSLSVIAQNTLLSNVGREMALGGPVHTIPFCSLNASNILDSLSNRFEVKISRISERYRNVQHRPTEYEVKLLKELEQNQKKDSVIQTERNATYYKSIKIGMPTCLKCHGTPEKDITLETLNILDSIYPDDNAKNYSLGDFRGAWKIEFTR